MNRLLILNMIKKLTLSVLALFLGASLFAQKSYFITSPDKVKLCINEFGNGKPIVLLAGGPGMAATYMSGVYNKLPGFRVIVPDQRGTGKSRLPKIDSTTISTSQYVEDVEALRIYLKLPKIIVVGHSWGGMLAMAYAAKHPDKVERLILLDSGGVTEKFYEYFDDNLMMRLSPREIKETASKDQVISFKAIYPGYFYNRQKAMETVNTVTNANFGQQTDKIIDTEIKDYGKTAAERTKNLKRYKGPLLIMQGRQDPIGESNPYEDKMLMPQAKIVFIEKCGHIPWLEGKQQADTFFKNLKEAIK